jgi:GTP-binding protein
MQPDNSLPVVVIVGRPNVGKSTLFNAIIRDRRSIVGDEPGITRDRILSLAEHRGRKFELIDTGGILPHDEDLIPTEIFKQARVALEQAAHIVFVIDGRAEITSTDRELAVLLRKFGKPVTLAINKIDVAARENLVPEFYALGLSDLFPVSAEHRQGLEELLDHVVNSFADSDTEDAKPKKADIRVAIIGRPNVGKSTLLNALIGSERSIVSPVAGTTRDAVDETIEHDGTTYTFVDTAGIRRKGKTHLMAEKLSVVMARRHIRMANVVLLLIDASEGVVGLDANIAGYALEDGRSVIICVNKWDVSKEKNQKKFTQDLRDAMRFLEFAPILFLSAQKGLGVDRIFDAVKKAYEAASRRVTTGELNRFVESLNVDTDVRLKYVTQVAIRPPTFVAFTGGNATMHFSIERFLINQLRKEFGFAASPVVLKVKAANATGRSRKD